MNYRETLNYIHKISSRGSRPGLSRITELCARLGDPQKDLRCIHITGTNGKGSTAAYLTSILRAAGYRVGSFTSPYVKRFNERIALNARPVTNARLAAAATAVRAAADGMTDPPTEFELITAVGFLIFKEEGCDVVVLEVGMGGRYDATNIIKAPLCSVVTGIAKDHENFLGNTLAAIAGEKAGIIKEGRPLVCAELPKEAADVIFAEAKHLHAPCTRVDPQSIRILSHTPDALTVDVDGKVFTTALVGVYQAKNLALAVKVAEVLNQNGLPISPRAIKNGIARARWRARFEVLQKEPLVIFDGGHNPDGVRAAVDTLRALGIPKVHLLTGLLADKAYTEMVDTLAPVAARVFAIAPDNPRRLPAERLAALYRARGKDAAAFDRIADGKAAAVSAAKADGRPLLIIGSLYLYKDIIRSI